MAPNRSIPKRYRARYPASRVRRLSIVKARVVDCDQRTNFRDLSSWASRYAGQSVIVSCQHGSAPSEGIAAWLRNEGINARTHEGGHDAWCKDRQPLVRDEKVARRDAAGRSVWSTRARPKRRTADREWHSVVPVGARPAIFSCQGAGAMPDITLFDLAVFLAGAFTAAFVTGIAYSASTISCARDCHK